MTIVFSPLSTPAASSEIKEMGVAGLSSDQTLSGTVARKTNNELEATAWAPSPHNPNLFTHASVGGHTALDLAVAGVGGYLVAAVKDDANALKVIYWQAGTVPGVNIKWLDAGTATGQIDQLAICAYQSGSSWKAVTASTAGDKSLSVIVWDLEASGSSFKVKQLGRNTNAAANKAERVAIASWGGGVVTAVQEHGTNALKLIAWDISPAFTVTQKGTKTEQVVDQVKMVQVRTPTAPYHRLATAARLQDRSLEVITWDVLDGGSTIKLLDRAQPPAPAHVQNFAIASPPAYQLPTTGGGDYRSQIITGGLRATNSALRITVWFLGSGGGLTRIVDVDLAAEQQVALDYLLTGTHTGDFGEFPMYEVAMGVQTPDGKLGFMLGALYDDGVVQG